MCTLCGNCSATQALLNFAQPFLCLESQLWMLLCFSEHHTVRRLATDKACKHVELTVPAMACACLSQA